MTSSIAFPIHSQKLKESAPPRRFLKDVAATLDELAPEYRGMLDTIDSVMFHYLHETLGHWSRDGNVSKAQERMFKRTKVVEAFAFWKGFIGAGGALPPDIPHVDVPRLVSVQSRPIVPSFEAAVVIPVGGLNQKIVGLLDSNLRLFETHHVISSIYLVFDGVDPAGFYPKKLLNGKVTVLRQPQRSGPAAARNAGIAAALRGSGSGTGGIMFVDSDVSITRQSLDALWDACTRSQSIICPRIHSPDKGWLNLYHDINGTLNGRYMLGDCRKELLFGTTSCMFVPRDVFEGGILFSADFHDAAGEDIDFCLRARQRGYSIVAADHVQVIHDYGYTNVEVADWAIFKARFQRYGAGEWQLLQRHPWYYHALDSSLERMNLV